MKQIQYNLLLFYLYSFVALFVNPCRVEANDLEAVEEALKKDLDPNTVIDGQTALQIAASLGYNEMIELLLKYKADIHATSNIFMPGHTPLHLAAGFLKICGFPISILRLKLLRHVPKQGFPETIQLLIKKGSKIDMKNHMTYTPLHLAADSNHPDAVKVLLEAGADFNIKTDNGKTAKDLATAKKYGKVVSVFLTHPPQLRLLHPIIRKHMSAEVKTSLRSYSEPRIKQVDKEEGGYNYLSSSSMSSSLFVNAEAALIDDVIKGINKCIEKQYEIKEPTQESKQEPSEYTENNVNIPANTNNSENGHDVDMAYELNAILSKMERLKMETSVLVKDLAKVMTENSFLKGFNLENMSLADLEMLSKQLKFSKYLVNTEINNRKKS